MRQITFAVLLALAASGGALMAADTGKIRARGGPTGAGLFIDGKYVGPAGRFTVPESYEVAPGEHEVKLSDPRYEDYTTKVTVTAGKTAKIKYKLKKLEPPKGPFGRLRLGGGEPESFISVTAGDVGAVYLNGKFWGHVDEFNNLGSGMLLPPGSYELWVDSPLFGQIKQTVTIEANKLTIVPLKKK